jgi:nucleoside recognition membrane protein YjiH
MFSGATNWPMGGLIMPVFLIFLAGAVFGSALIGWGIWEAGIETGKAMTQAEGKK